MRTSITRRQLATALAGSVAVLGQTTGSERQEAPDELLEQAKGRIQRNAKELDEFSLKMATEPAFVFKP
jgi:hypothetical protein